MALVHLESPTISKLNKERTTAQAYFENEWLQNVFLLLTYVHFEELVYKGQGLKVSKFRKQIILSSHTPKKQRKFSHFFVLTSKKY